RAEDVPGMGQGDQTRLRSDGGLDGVRIDYTAAVRFQAREADAAGQLHGAQRPADTVVFEVASDDVIARAEHALEGHVEGVGAVEREDEALGFLAVEELIE